MYKRDFIKKKAVKLKDKDLWNEYVYLRNMVTQAIKQGKKDYAIAKVSECQNNCGKMWKVLNRLTGRDKRKSTSNVNAEKYNEYFNSVGTNTVAHLLSNVTSYDSNVYWRCSESIYKFAFEEVHVESVLKHLRNLGNESTIDVLGFDGKLLCHASNTIAPILCKIFNISIITQTVPADWKLSRVTPVYKGKGCRDEECNYRPISVICHVAKIMEKLVQNQVMKYLVDHELITCDQSAYLKQHNTQTSLHRVLDDWSWNIDDSLITGICALDISKCFDTISHDILLKKMHLYGFDEQVIKWFKSYLCNRGHKVSCNSECSSIKYVNIGVPQGSILGPTLFLLYVNDINNYLGTASCNLYADDVLIYCSGESMHDVTCERLV
jgi:hypothetical protein